MHNDSNNGSQYDQGFIWNRGGYTPLLFAARHGNVAAGRLLVAAGANIDDRAPNPEQQLWPLRSTAGSQSLRNLHLHMGQTPMISGLVTHHST
ncbi:MAG: hypothetical protein Ct9H300mP25_01970 [Acidobacteriota bacterium]|nr:MAG: hypothetical protein Ct9H300mP25_01970 [Acidobacteriota bacterium]